MNPRPRALDLFCGAGGSSIGENCGRPLAIDLFCGLGGWTEGLLAEGYDVIGFDIERHQYGDAKYPAQLVLQDVLTLHGRQLKDAALIVASPPCQAYSYRAMPWKRAKAMPPPDNSLFEACFRIQREACEAAGHHIPMVVENVRGAQKWVGRARWNFGSFYLWGDVPALMPMTVKRPAFKGGDRNIGRASGEHIWNTEFAKNPGFRFDGSGRSFQSESVDRHIKNNGGSWFNVAHNTTSGKVELRSFSSKSSKRKAASAMIAKIPLPLSRHIAATWKPREASP